MLQLDFNVDHQWLLTEPSKIFHMLSMLKELPQAHHSRIEWLTKRPTIRPVGIENLQVELFNNEQHIEIKGNVEGEEELLDLWEDIANYPQQHPLPASQRACLVQYH